jgi:hypothetical protein
MFHNVVERLIRFLGHLRSETQRLARQANRLAEGLDDLDYLISQWERDPSALTGLATISDPRLRASLEEKLLRQARLALAAEQGVNQVLINWQADGSCSADIDGHKPLCLSQKLGLLLEILAADEGVSDDRFVGWKSPEDIRKALLRRTGTPVSVGNLNTLVWRLREALLKVELPPGLVQRCTRKGLRFAVLRRIPALTADSPTPLRPADPGSPASQDPV